MTKAPSPPSPAPQPSPAQEHTLRRKAPSQGDTTPHRRRLYAGLTIGALAVIVVSGFIALCGSVEQQRQTLVQTAQASASTRVSLPSASSADVTSIEGVQVFDVQGGHTVETVSYSLVPPPGGQHSAEWQNCGIYNKPVSNAAAVHALEHGAVWVGYTPDIGQQSIDILRAQVRGKPYTLLSPTPGITVPIAAVAWGLRLEVQDANDPRLAEFIRRYANGPQTPQPGAPCTVGIGSPMR